MNANRSASVSSSPSIDVETISEAICEKQCHCRHSPSLMYARVVRQCTDDRQPCPYRAERSGPGELSPKADQTGVPLLRSSLRCMDPGSPTISRSKSLPFHPSHRRHNRSGSSGGRARDCIAIRSLSLDQDEYGKVPRDPIRAKILPFHAGGHAATVPTMKWHHIRLPVEQIFVAMELSDEMEVRAP